MFSFLPFMKSFDIKQSRFIGALLGITLSLTLSAFAAEDAPPKPPRAARSVHLGYPGPEGVLFHNEMVIEKSTAGSYFMAAGWNTGYFGLQELADHRKVVIFSVWDPTKGNDPKAVKLEEQVECLYQAPDVRIRRFGGEGTGGQCMADYDWQLGQTNRFVVTAKIEGEKTAYSGYLWQPAEQKWKQLVTFRTRSGGLPMHGMYSFVEDFRRDTQSVKEVRRARFSGGWVQNAKGEWTSLAKARFTASSATWEAKDTIDAGRDGDWFYLMTGGDTHTTNPLRTILERPGADTKPPALTLPATPAP